MRHIKLIVALTITLFIAQIFVARAAMPIDAPAENPKILILHYSDIWQHFIKKAKENVSDLLEVSFYNYRMGNFPIPADIDFCAYDVILINEPTVGMEGFRQSIELAKRHTRVIVISPGVLEGNVDMLNTPGYKSTGLIKAWKTFKD